MEKNAKHAKTTTVHRLGGCGSCTISLGGADVDRDTVTMRGSEVGSVTDVVGRDEVDRDTVRGSEVGSGTVVLGKTETGPDIVALGAPEADPDTVVVQGFEAGVIVSTFLEFIMQGTSNRSGDPKTHLNSFPVDALRKSNLIK